MNMMLHPIYFDLLLIDSPGLKSNLANLYTIFLGLSILSTLYM